MGSLKTSSSRIAILLIGLLVKGILSENECDWENGKMKEPGEYSPGSGYKVSEMHCHYRKFVGKWPNQQKKECPAGHFARHSKSFFLCKSDITLDSVVYGQYKEESLTILSTGLLTFCYYIFTWNGSDGI